MNVHCREQFVKLHSQPLLARLYEHMALYNNGAALKRAGMDQMVELSPPPPRGDFDIQRVISSKYFFN